MLTCGWTRAASLCPRELCCGRPYLPCTTAVLTGLITTSSCLSASCSPIPSLFPASTLEQLQSGSSSPSAMAREPFCLYLHTCCRLLGCLSTAPDLPFICVSLPSAGLCLLRAAVPSCQHVHLPAMVAVRPMKAVCLVLLGCRATSSVVALVVSLAKIQMLQLL